MSLYLDYRPSTLEEVKGNSDVIETLEKMLSDSKKCPHSFLLTGPTGTGKTTIARIIADKLGCKGKDYVEINASDINGIDAIREIIKKTDLSPMEGSCRVWVLDEAHRITKDAQNALLKKLEDTPKHVYFILCTTDSQKLLPTIKGRCSTFQTKPLTDVQMKGLLRRVTREEGDSLEQEVMDQIILDSRGLPRHALQILEQVLNVSPEKRLEVAKKAEIQQTQSIELCRALIQRKGWKVVSSILSGLMEEDPETIRRMVLGYAQAVLLKNDDVIAGLILEEMMEPTYDAGWPRITYACYSITKSK